MSEQDSSISPMRTLESPHRNVTANNDHTDDVAASAANNSIIGKVKSRVSSIFPNSLSKWFSPSAKNNNDSHNGSSSIGGISRRRRRLDIEEDDDDDEDVDEEDAEDGGDEEHDLGEYDEQLLGHQRDDEDNSDDESNNSEDAIATIATSFKVAQRRDVLRSCGVVRQPMTKRSRLNVDVTTPTTVNRNRETLIMQRQPILSSTPAIGVSNMRAASTGRSTNRYTHLNLYGNQRKKEEAFCFQSSPIANSIDSPSVSGSRYVSTSCVNESINFGREQTNLANLQCDMSSRRSLNIPPATQTSVEHYPGLSNLKRQALSNIKHEFSNTSSLPRRTSTTIFENEGEQLQEEVQLELGGNVDDEYKAQQLKSFNGRLTDSVTYKRQKLTNGADDALNITSDSLTREGTTNLRDSASESSDGGGAGTVSLTTGIPEITAVSSGQVKRKAVGLFNLSAANSSRNGSRTSSFGNGLNFYTHLEGRKSLFAGTQSAASAQPNLNNSTLSLTSLNRRQFNASIYGSTSALSDSRLLNTFSPFYKGKTTYGGASAYNKYAMLGTGAGANAAARITPTLIRPTSSLSTLSSSNNSITTAVVGGGNASAENSSALSTTAKRILDLINDFATPLSDAKKMASNLKSSQQQNQPLLTKSRRFNDADLIATRAVRLSQIRSPYMRPTVTLHPTANTNLPKLSTVLPPVRELQVPSMSQLLQMKKMQSTTERSRQIATENSHKITAQQPLAATSLSEYTLPVELHSDNIKHQHPQKHTNKIKNKITTSSVRVTATKDSVDDAPLLPVNLPNIAFPIMQSAPKFDISFENTSVPTSLVSGNGDGKVPFGKSVTESTFAFKATDAADKTTQKTSITISSPTSRSKTNFKFSAPLQLEGEFPPNVAPFIGNYKFSSPLLVRNDDNNGQTQLSPQLKTGSVLDALKKPFTIPIVTSQSCSNNSLAAQFKKSPNEWECETCMIRNKQESTKCVACETPRKGGAVELKSPVTMPSFGNQFKKSASEWECDTCMIRNKQDVSKCIACETPRKCSSSDSKTTSLVTSHISEPSFGEAFKPKANTWECPTCLINNKNESYECVACETKKPGSSSNSSSIKPKVGVVPLAPADDSFTSLAASQIASKWECEACMTRNDTSRIKCVCCEQAKPGSLQVSDNVPAFSFGSTAAAKFSFGFGGANAPKEEELRKNPNDDKKTETTTTTTTAPAKGFVFGAAVTATPNQTSGFTFGIKPAKTAASEDKEIVKDITDSTKSSTTKTVLTDFKFGSSTPSLVSHKISTSTIPETKTTLNIVSSTIATTATTTTTSSVNFSIPTAVSASTDNKEVSTLAFGSSNVPSTSTSKSVQQPGITGFSFGLSKSTETTVPDVGQSATDIPKQGDFTFNVPAPTYTSTHGSTSIITATTTVAAPTAAIKPLFSFSSTTSASSTSTAVAAQTTRPPTTLQNSAGFSFGNMSTSSSMLSEAKPLFGVSSVTATTKPSSSTISSAVAKSVFGSFGAASTTNTVFGVTVPSTTSPLTTTSFETSSTFGSLTSSTAGPSPQFGMFGNSETTTKSKPGTSLFGAPSNGTASANTPFSFGSPTPTTNANAITTTLSTTWPKNSFVFGSPATTAATSIICNEPAKQTIPSFGGFGASSTSAGVVNPAISSSIFGNASTGTFGSISSATPIFSANSSAAAVGSTGNINNNLFSSAVSSSVAPAFGVTPFGSSTSSAMASTFGRETTGPSTGLSAPSSTFGGFGSLSSATPTSNTTDGASAAKKSDTTFSFGATPVASQSTSGGFNFGSSAALPKPAFNFGASTAAATGGFNFTGSAEIVKTATQPFQFGATPLAPVFNFSGGAVETTPNAPFQFNAGAASPAASNIFAPAPAAAGAQMAQQARRKIRAPTRRLTPR